MRPRNTRASLALLHAATLGCWVWVCLGFVRLGHSARADDACISHALVPTSQDTTKVLDEARACAERGDYVRARGLYAWLLARQPGSRDAALAMARTYAWSQCYKEATDGYQALLRANAADTEARAGLVDVLLWQDLRADAERELTQGLARSPNSPELWQRRATLALRNDDTEQALAATDRALALAPKDAELRAFRQRVYTYLVRMSARAEAYPADNPNVYKGTLQLWHRIGRFELSADALVQDRAGGALQSPIVDGLYTFGGGYHTGPLATVGVNIGFGAPARALPRYLAKLWVSSDFAPRWSAGLSYAIWSYVGAKTAHIVAPSLAFAPNDAWRVELRGWGTWLAVRDAMNARQLGSVFAVGGRVGHSLAPGVRLDAAYTYGPQLDYVVISPDFVRITSHVFALSADIELGRRYGLQPLLALEHRKIQQNPQLIWGAELGAYAHW